ncbi:MAG: D-alanine--D-alanine ligase [Alphaproteobacteria bacterium]|nr:D-alanine--D-alanine ligase [Alphaproteobacteria bacterium]
MRVGFTYDLRDDYLKAGYNLEETAEFDSVNTIESIEGALVGLGHDVERIGNVRALAARLVEGRRWDLVFNIAEGMHGIGREAQVPALLDAYAIPYTFSDTLVMALTLHKGLTKHVVRAHGVPTADFAVVETPEDAERIDLPYPLFVKPVAEGTGRGIGGKSRVDGKAELMEGCREIIATYRQPAIVETFLPGREFTVGMVGEGASARSIGALEVGFLGTAESTIYGLVNKEECETRVTYTLVDDATSRAAEDVAIRAWQVLNCRDAGRIDLRCDGAGRPVFIEVNPLAGLNPLHSDLPILAAQAGIPYAKLIEMIVESAGRRVVRSRA